MIPVPHRVIDRINRHTTPGPGECIDSKYSLGSHGYPQIGWDEQGKRCVTLCHLVLWRYHHGLIPSGMTVDHDCKRKVCVNIKHYRLLTNLENARRHSGRDWPLGECANGHSDEKYWHKPASGGKGYCKACRKDIAEARKAGWRRNQETPLPRRKDF